MRRPLGKRWLHFLDILLLLPALLYSEKLSPRSVTYLKAFQSMFPEVDVKSATVFDFVSEEENIRRVMLLNGMACRERQLVNKIHHRVTRSVYKLLGLPIDIMYSTPIPPTPPCEPDDQYGYVDQ